MTLFKYQKTKRYHAQVPGGVEALAAVELEALGASEVVTGLRVVDFTANPDVLYAVNYQSRLITRVIAPLVSFRCRNRDDLYKAGLSVDWPSVFSLKNTFGIFSNVSDNPNIRHSQFASLCVKDAVADLFREKTGERPDVDKLDPDVSINLYIKKEKGTISLDTSGGSLHRRGYRRETVIAPMQEIIAAAMVDLSGWKGDTPLYDPMCGAGTLLCEAMMKAFHIPPGYFRKNFGFRLLPDFDTTLWDKIKEEADTKIQKPKAGLIAGSDFDRDAVKAAKTNCRTLPGGDMITISKKDFMAIPNLENQVIICNPPYGIRMEKDRDLAPFFKKIGDFLKQRCKGSTAYIYFGNREMIKAIGLKPAFKRPMRNAGLDGRVVKFEMY